MHNYMHIMQEMDEIELGNEMTRHEWGESWGGGGEDEQANHEKRISKQFRAELFAESV